MNRSAKVPDRARRASVLFMSTALLFTVGACEKLIGIEDTPVVADGAAGMAPAAHAGASGAGAPQAGDGAQGGQDDVAGAPGGGKSGSSGGGASGGASAGTAGAPAACDCKGATPVCVNGACVALGPTPTPAGSNAGNTAFFIDATEVTNEQYAAFLEAKGSDTSGQRPECDWNKSYQPAAAIGDDKRPAVNVDFCDAVAFCEWAGERLCGALGGGQVAPQSLTDPTLSEWYLACAGPDKQAYPYGNDYQAGYCNDTADAMADAGKFTKCDGHYMGVRDLVGNAAEWVDSCVDDPGGDHAQDLCELMGGTYLRDDFDCASRSAEARNTTASAYGFRCCSK